MTAAEKRLRALRASLPYSVGPSKAALRAMIAELEAEIAGEPKAAPAFPLQTRSLAEATNSSSRGPAPESAVLVETGSDAGISASAPHASRTTQDNGSLHPKAERHCFLCGGINRRTGKYCSRDCANKARREWHAAHPGGNRAHGRQPANRSVAARQLQSEALRRRWEERVLEADDDGVTRQRPSRPSVELGWNPAVVIRPPRPAATKRYFDTGRACPFQDDLNAVFDKGSPGPLPSAERSQARMSALGNVL